MERPSNSMDGMHLVRRRVALDRKPTAAAGEMEPALHLDAGRILGQPEPAIILFRRDPGVRLRTELATEPELGERTATAVGTLQSQRQGESVPGQDRAYSSALHALAQGRGRNYLYESPALTTSSPCYRPPPEAMSPTR